MKKQLYIVEIEMPDGDMVSANWLKDIIQHDCEHEDKERQKVSVRELDLPEGLDEAAEEYDSQFPNMAIRENPHGSVIDAFKTGAKWMAEQGVTLNISIDELSCGPYNACVEQGLTSEDEVIFQIRKK